MAETRVVSERYEALAADLIENEPALAAIAASDVRIAYLSSDAKKCSKGRPVLGQCEKVPDKYRWAVPYDFAVTVFEPNVAGFNESRLRILMLHELMHVGVFADDDGEETYKVVPHDVEDFSAIVERFGIGWQAGAAGQGV